MTTATMMRPEASLREEDLVPGRPWVDPATCLEYEDFHAFFCGKDPIPHWRNARIKEAISGPSLRDGRIIACGAVYSTREEAIAGICRGYDRDGNSFFGPKYFDRNSRTSATLPWY